MTATKSTVNIKTTSDLIASIPYMLGYQPTDCLIVVCVQSDDQLGLIARTALNDLTGQDLVKSAELISVRAKENNTKFAFIVAYYNKKDHTDNSISTLIAEFQYQLENQGIPYDPWTVTDGQCQSIYTGETYPMNNLTENLAATDLAKLPVAESRDHAYQIKPAPEARIKNTRKIVTSWITSYQMRADTTQWFDDSIQCWLKLNPSQPNVEKLGKIAGALYVNKEYRDTILLGIISDNYNKPSEERAQKTMSGLLDPDQALLPDPAKLAKPKEKLQSLISHTAGKYQIAPLTLLALLYWWEGYGGQARFYIDQANKIDHDNTLRTLINHLIERGIAPGWVQAQNTQ